MVFSALVGFYDQDATLGSFQLSTFSVHRLWFTERFLKLRQGMAMVLTGDRVMARFPDISLWKSNHMRENRPGH